MAMLVALGGAGVSTAFGLGPGPGWLVGSVLGNILFPPSGPKPIEGPRLGDLSVTSSAYGAPIAVPYGTLRLAGNMIWSSGIQERRNVQKAGGKGGGAPAQTAVSYSYSASFAIAFGEGPAEEVLRIWADGKLIVDRTGQSPRFAKRSLRFRFYPGDETQLPDPLIESDVGDGLAPAHRGLCYLVFEDLALADFGNRIPSISAEIAFTRGAVSQPMTIASHALGMISGPGGVDPRRNRAYRINTGDDFLRVVDLSTLTVIRQLDSADLALGTDPAHTDLGVMTVGVDSGCLYLTYDISSCSPIAKIDPDSLRAVGTWGQSSSGASNTAFRFIRAQDLWEMTVLAPTRRRFLAVTSDTYGYVGLLDADAMTYLWRGEVDENDAHYIVGPHDARSGETFCYLIGFGGAFGAPAPTFSIYSLSVTGSAAPVWNEAGTDALTTGVTFEKVATLLCTDILPGSGTWHSVGSMAWDPADEGIIIHCAFTGGPAGSYQPYLVKWRPMDGVVWATAVNGHLDGPGVAQSQVLFGRYGVLNGSATVSTSIDTTTGAATEQSWSIPWTVANGVHWYDGATHSVLAYGSSGAVRIYLDRASGGAANLGDVVSDLCRRAGLEASDIDVSQVVDGVPGFVVSRPMAARAALEPLASAFAFDGVESDGVLAFRTRSGNPMAVVPKDDLVVLDEETSEAWREVRTQEVELPEQVAVVHLDKDADYVQGTQRAKRAAKPLATMLSANQSILELPIAMDASQAKGIAQRSLYQAWLERTQYSFSLPWTWMALEPTDVVDVVLNDRIIRSRLLGVHIGADLSLSLTAVAEDADIHLPSAVAADKGSGVTVQTIPGPAATRLFLPDLPLLRDTDDLAGSGSRLYAFLAGYGPAGWPGAALYRSADGSVWSPMATALAEAAWGTTVNALGTPSSPFATDTMNTLTIIMATGGDRLESVTTDALLAGANPALVLKANGAPEIIQFRDVALNADGSFTLSTLLRGRRGTDVFIDGHQPGELFLLLEAETLEALSLSLGDLGLARRWRAVGFGSLLEEADEHVLVHTGRDLKPYAPVHIRAERNGDPPDILFSWVRRTRIGGDLRDGTGAVPLAEASEAYEVDILNMPGGAVVRTLASTTPSVVYPNADIVSDFGGVPASLSVVVYQVSAVIGRGVGRAVTLEIV